MDVSAEVRGRLRVVLGILLCGMSATVPVPAETFEGCSWAGPEPELILDRTLPAVDLMGSLGSEVIDFLHGVGAPVAFISRAAEDPDVRFQRSGATTIRELIDEVLAQAPGYRLGVVGRKLVIYPIDEGFGALVTLGEPREVRRVDALLDLVHELGLRSPVLGDLWGPTLRPFGTVCSDLISVGGPRTVVEHLVTLVVGRPTLTFVIYGHPYGGRKFSLRTADLIKEFLLEAPKRVEVGEEFQVVPRIVLADGKPVTLIGSECWVYYQSLDESILKIDDGGRVIAIAEGTGGIFGKYEDAAGASVDVEVSNDP